MLPETAGQGQNFQELVSEIYKKLPTIIIQYDTIIIYRTQLGFSLEYLAIYKTKKVPLAV